MKREAPTAVAFCLSPVSRQSAPRRCGTNRSCACVAIVVRIVGALVSQADEQMDTGEGWRRHQRSTDKEYECREELPVEAHLEIGCVLRTGELGDGFSLLGHQLKHLQHS